MREIKFIFVIDNKKVTRGYSLSEIIDYGRPLSEEDILDDAFECIDSHCEYNGYCECENNLKSITHKLQYTGLKDKNGVEIYEGDILKDRAGKIFIVEYKNDRFYAKYHIDNYYSSLFLQINGKGISVVIGNIYENKELLDDVPNK